MLGKLVREAKSMSDFSFHIGAEVRVDGQGGRGVGQPSRWNSHEWSFALRRSPERLEPNVQVNLVARDSRNIRRAVRSSFGVECAAFSTGLEHADLVRVEWRLGRHVAVPVVS